MYKDGDVWKQRSIDEAIERLGGYDPKPPTDPEQLKTWEKVGGFEKHVPRWKEEAKVALEYLINYRNTHFPKGE
jgi:hypothetical protein